MTLINMKGGVSDANTSRLNISLNSFPDSKIQTAAQFKKTQEDDINKLPERPLRAARPLRDHQPVRRGEHTRALGLRADTRDRDAASCGMTRRQVRRMIRYESIVTRVDRRRARNRGRRLPCHPHDPGALRPGDRPHDPVEHDRDLRACDDPGGNARGDSSGTPCCTPERPQGAAVRVTVADGSRTPPPVVTSRRASARPAGPGLRARVGRCAGCPRTGRGSHRRRQLLCNRSQACRPATIWSSGLVPLADGSCSLRRCTAASAPAPELRSPSSSGSSGSSSEHPKPSTTRLRSAPQATTIRASSHSAQASSSCPWVAATLWKSRRRDDNLWWRYLRRLLLTAGTVLVGWTLVFPFFISYGLHARDAGRRAGGQARCALPAGVVHDERRAYAHGWYVPSRNRAAVIAFPGRAGPQKHARHARAARLRRAAFSTVAAKERATANRNAYGWALGQATSPRRRRSSSVVPTSSRSRIGGIGLSVGGEMMLQAAAESNDLKAVVSEWSGLSFRPRGRREEGLARRADLLGDHGGHARSSRTSRRLRTSRTLVGRIARARSSSSTRPMESAARRSS